MKYRYLIALAASVTGTAFGSLSAPMPEFKSSKQLAEWRAEKAAEPSVKAAAEDPAFYTGKPYVNASGGYAFKFRSYNPELARWTSEDPSGFPDGANQNIYAPQPTCEIDSEGLQVITVHDHYPKVIQNDYTIAQMILDGGFTIIAAQFLTWSAYTEFKNSVAMDWSVGDEATPGQKVDQLDIYYNGNATLVGTQKRITSIDYSFQAHATYYTFFAKINSMNNYTYE